MEQVFTLMNQTLGGPLGSVVAALFILVIGFILAKIISGLACKLFAKGDLNKRLNTSTGKSVDAEAIGGKVIFFFIMAMVFAAAIGKLDIAAVSEPLAAMINNVLNFLVNIAGIAVLAIIGWVIATVVRSLITSGLGGTSLDETASTKIGIEGMSSKIANVVYWLIMLVVFTMVLRQLDLSSIFAPLSNMFDIMFASLSNIIGAALIFGIGYIIARIARTIVTNIVSELDLQALTSKVGISSEKKDALPKLAGTLVFLVIIIPITLSALDALKMEVITHPATNMINMILAAIPKIIGAAAIVGITYFIMRIVVKIIKDILENTQINALPEKMGVADVLGNGKLSDVAGSLIMFFAMLFAVVAAADMLELTIISEIVAEFLVFGGSIFKGVVILFIGFWLANLVSGIIERSDEGSKFLSSLARVLIIGLVLAMGLKAMGIADSIVNLAFGLTLGSVAVAFALSFGLGGQEAAARFLRELQDKQDNKDAE